MMKLTDDLDTAPSTDLAIVEGAIVQPIPVSPTVLEIDGWTRRRGEELRVSPQLKDYERIDELAWADLHASLYERAPDFAENPEDELRKRFVEGMFVDPAIDDLRQHTMMDDWATEIALQSVGASYEKLVAEMEHRAADAAAGKKPKKGAPSDEDLIASAVAQAAKQASGAVDEAEQTAAAFGLEPGQGSQHDLQAVKKILNRTAKSPKLREIVENAGRFTALARSRQRIRACQGMDNVVGVRLSDDLPRLLGSELAALGHPVLRVDAVRRLAEKQMMSLEHQGVERVAKGPIMVWVDESGSMEGNRIATAKGLSLAMAWVARKQKRWCSLVGFSSSSQLRSIVLPPGRWDEDALIKWCEGFYNGGTVVPFDDAEKLFVETRAPRGKTDILLVTDGETHSTPEMLQKFLDWKKENQARLISLVIDCDGSTVGPYSDELHTLQALSTAEDGVVAAVSV